MLAVCSGLVRGLGDTKTPMLYNVLFNLINIVLNYLLIYPVGSVKLMGFTVRTIGLGLGVRGAALGTSGGALIAGLLMLRVLFSKRRAISIGVRDDYRPDKVIVRQMLYLSVPVMFERISISFGQILTSALATGLGNRGAGRAPTGKYRRIDLLYARVWFRDRRHNIGRAVCRCRTRGFEARIRAAVHDL